MGRNLWKNVVYLVKFRPIKLWKARFLARSFRDTNLNNDSDLSDLNFEIGCLQFQIWFSFENFNWNMSKAIKASDASEPKIQIQKRHFCRVQFLTRPVTLDQRPSIRLHVRFCPTTNLKYAISYLLLRFFCSLIVKYTYIARWRYFVFGLSCVAIFCFQTNLADLNSNKLGCWTIYNIYK